MLSTVTQKAQTTSQSVYLSAGADIVLTTNLWMNAGLVNGAKGKIRAIVYESGKTIGTMPETTFVEFPDYRWSAHFFDDEDR